MDNAIETPETGKPVYLFRPSGPDVGELYRTFPSDRAFRHPRKRGYVLLPGNATYERPPKAEPGRVARRMDRHHRPIGVDESNAVWKNVEDLRGAAFYDPKTNTASRIQSLGELPPEEAVRVPDA